METGSNNRRAHRYHVLLWLPALLLTASDAWAWGLYTHVWYAQSLLWLIPIADPRMRAAAQRFPRLVLAGACLPDLALVGGIAGSRNFETTHGWERVAELLANAKSDEQRALALGYASHLLTDIFAHNHFVPAHEALWLDVPILTHALCEWALDHHVSRQLFATPSSLFRQEEEAICAYLCSDFSCTPAEAIRVIRTLGRGDALLRMTGLPALSLGVGSLFDLRMVRRFNHYLNKTTRRLEQINRVIAGDKPIWVANPERHTARAAIAGEKPAKLRSRLDLPGNVFASVVSEP